MIGKLLDGEQNQKTVYALIVICLTWKNKFPFSTETLCHRESRYVNINELKWTLLLKITGFFFLLRILPLALHGLNNAVMT